jgi:hypothetical protein
MALTERTRRPAGWSRAGLFVVLAFTTMSIAACDAFGVRGQGEVTTEPRQVDTFTAIDVGGGIRLIAAAGQPQSVAVRAQPNILPLIVMEVSNGTLRVTSSERFTTTEGVEVNVSVPTLSALTLSGGSNGQASGIVGTELTVTLSGGSRLDATGTIESLTLNGSGGSRAELEQLAAATVAVDLSGGSVAIVQASQEVQGSASGGASLTVAGEATLNVQATGGASVVRR